MTAALVFVCVISSILCCGAHEHEGEDKMNSTGLVLDYLKDNTRDEPQIQTSIEVENGNKKNPAFEWQKWAYALVNIIKYPETPEHSQAILYRDEDVMIIRDKFPKAKFHFLVLPVSTWIDTAADVTRKDIPIIEKMAARANKWLEELRAKDAEAVTSNFKLGFHGKPSMKQLHLHVISDDFDAPAMKHSKHYNTFTTRYFLEVNEFIERVRREGYYPIDFNEFGQIANGPTMCHRCGMELRSNWDRSKKHYTTCNGVKPETTNTNTKKKNEANQKKM